MFSSIKPNVGNGCKSLMIYLLLFQVGLVCSLLPVKFLTAKVETGDVPSTSKGKGKMNKCWRLVIVG